MPTLIAARTVPPNKSGSSHIVGELLRLAAGRLVVVGGTSVFSKPRDSRMHLARTEVSLFGRGARFFWLPRLFFFPGLVWQLASIARKEKAPRILAVFPDGYYCLAAFLAAKIVGTEFAIWFHNTYSFNRSGIKGWVARKLEQRMLDAAARIFLISDSLLTLYQKAYPALAAKMSVVPHPGGKAVSYRPPAPSADGSVKCLLIGNINQSNADAVQRMLEALGDAPKIELRVATQVPRALLRTRVDMKDVKFLGYLPEEDLERELLEADICLLPHGLRGAYAPEEYLTIFPTRVVTYMRFGKTIFSLCPQGSFIANFLKERDCAHVVTSEDTASIRAAFDELRNSREIQARISANARAAWDGFSTDAVIEKLLA